jgi:hypothetical protein
MITPEPAEIFEKAFDSMLSDLHTMLPVKVESVDLINKTVEVISQIKKPIPKEDGNYILSELPKLINVQIALPRTVAGHFISFPIDPGCYGRVCFSEYDFGQWLTLGKLCSPGDVEKFTLSSGVFTPDLWPTSGILPDILTNDLVMGVSGQTQLRFKGNTAEFTSSAAIASLDFVAVATLLDTFLNAFVTAVAPGGVPVVTPAPGAPCPIATALYATMCSVYPPVGPIDNKSTNLKAD